MRAFTIDNPYLNTCNYLTSNNRIHSIIIWKVCLTIKIVLFFRVVSISGSLRAHPKAIALRYLQRKNIMLDPNWQKGYYYDTGKFPRTGTKLARYIYNSVWDIALNCFIIHEVADYCLINPTLELLSTIMILRICNIPWNASLISFIVDNPN